MNAEEYTKSIHFKNFMNNLLSNEDILKTVTENYVAGQFIVGSVSTSQLRRINSITTLSFAPNPRIHSTKLEASREAERLAKNNPTKEFIVVEICGRVKATGVVWK